MKDFAAEIGRIRAHATEWFPEVAREVRLRTPDAGPWKVRASTVYFAMTEQENLALEALEEAVAQFGLCGDAPTGDGLLVRRAEGTQKAAPVHEVIRAANLLMQERMGFPLTLGVKSLDGVTMTTWPWDVAHGLKRGPACNGRRSGDTTGRHEDAGCTGEEYRASPRE